MKYFVVLLLCFSFSLHAQDLLSELEKNSSQEKEYTFATFKSTRLVNFHTLETLSKGTLDIRIAHRFAPFSTGANNFWGVDGPATIQLRADYALTDRLLIGVGRASEHKMFDGFAKYKLWRQVNGKKRSLSVTAFASINVDGQSNKVLGYSRYDYGSQRLAYVMMMMIGRKINSKLSLQVSPVFVHTNLVDKLTDKNDVLAAVYSGRYKLNAHIALTAEYLQRITRYTASTSAYHNVLSIGFDIETGGHVFQVFVTNGSAINEARTVPYTSTAFSNGTMLGFNLSRVFSFKKKG